MGRPPSKPPEMPMDIVAGNIACLMYRRKIKPEDMCKLLGYANARTFKTRMDVPSTFTGADLNHICSFFGVTLEQLTHDFMK